MSYHLSHGTAQHQACLGFAPVAAWRWPLGYRGRPSRWPWRGRGGGTGTCAGRDSRRVPLSEAGASMRKNASLRNAARLFPSALLPSTCPASRYPPAAAAPQRPSAITSRSSTSSPSARARPTPIWASWRGGSCCVACRAPQPRQPERDTSGALRWEWHAEPTKARLRCSHIMPIMCR